MTDPEPTPPDTGLTAAERAELEEHRKSKSEREAAAAADKDRELEELRQFKKNAEKAVPGPVKKADKPADPPATPPAASPPAKPRRRVARGWFDDGE